MAKGEAERYALAAYAGQLERAILIAAAALRAGGLVQLLAFGGDVGSDAVEIGNRQSAALPDALDELAVAHLATTECRFGDPAVSAEGSDFSEKHIRSCHGGGS